MLHLRRRWKAGKKRGGKECLLLLSLEIVRGRLLNEDEDGLKS